MQTKLRKTTKADTSKYRNNCNNETIQFTYGYCKTKPRRS